MTSETSRRRPGGRSARVAEAVLGAAADLVAERGNDRFSITELAARSGVHHASIYRRWGTTENVVLALATSQLEVVSPMPDTGSLRGDLLGYARGVAASIEGDDGLTFLKAVVATADHDEHPEDSPLAERGRAIQEMLDRATARDEPHLHYAEVLDCVLAPIYIRRLFRTGPIDDAYLQRLTERALATGG